MDALAIAASVVAFVDFGSNIVSLYREISQTRDGLPSELSDLSTQSPELSRNATSARDKIAELRARYPHQAESLDRLTSECLLAEKELQKLLGGFKPGWGAAGVGALRAWWKHDEISSLQGRLSNIRVQLNTSVLMCIMHDSTETRNDLGRVIDGLDTVQGAIQASGPNLSNASRGQPLENPSYADKIAMGLWTAISATSRSAKQPLVQAAGSCSNESALPKSNHTVCRRIVKALAFPDMMARENQIKEPFPTTFKWLLDDPSSSSAQQSSPVEPQACQRQDFKAWLQSSDNESPFWITGKPASGKTTVMKYICTNPKVRASLRLWAGDLDLLTCSVYFWNPGSSGQKSQAGLLRTILHQLLDQRPEFCPLAAPERYLYFQLAGTDAPNPDWTVEELREALNNLGSQIHDTAHLAIFIDGLDEYDGDLAELVGFVKELHQNHEVKLCISSRPWNTFKDAFKAYPSLRMEQHTRPDIEKYVRERMAGSDGLRELRKLEVRNRSVADLESQLIEKADGVFLWVVLVVEQLLIAARDDPDLDKVWELFEGLPPDLGDLYASMRRRLSPSLLETASRMYQLVFRWKDTTDATFNVGIFWMAITCSNPAKSPELLKRGEMAGIMPVLERRLAGCTGGMLQINRILSDWKTREEAEQYGNYVEFIHRTAYDWLRGMWSTVVGDGPLDYDPSLVILSCLTSPPTPQRLSAVVSGYRRGQQSFDFARTCNDSPETRRVLLCLIDQLDVSTLGNHLAISESVWDGLTEAGIRSVSAMHFFCFPYLQARFESGSQIEGAEAPSKLLQFVPEIFWSKRKREWWRVAADCVTLIPPDDDPTCLNMRLRTAEVLLQARFFHMRLLIREVEDRIRRNWWPLDYWTALLAGLQGRGFTQLPRDIKLTGMPILPRWTGRR
ncbi:hypothetical protein MAPG_04033 [Magnaporthiopsis poae ATCC 64411]|uniref:Nephrocystin 3-like N-terminal domain-containing protein n=1 Tax=Magnaporthiopsis poae (strain ATCC 64411 / 73-15) TaxID=644358 RepID=A0A0C4DVM5_MAGP6|nr:hypothetical protein MAPG_04033 [Magnaporthiopsis poae ATCC 64411]